MKLHYSPNAIVDIDDMLHYLAERSPRGAERVSYAISDAALDLTSRPGIGQRVNSSRGEIRRLVLKKYPYIVFYRVGVDEITIIGVRHAARDPSSMPDEM